MKVLPIQAHCAVGPDGKIDIDLIRRNSASAQHAAKTVHGKLWSQLTGEGWSIILVSVRPAGDASDHAPESARKPPPGRRAPPAAVEPRPRRPDRMSAEEYRRFIGGGALVRCGK